MKGATVFAKESDSRSLAQETGVDLELAVDDSEEEAEEAGTESLELLFGNRTT